MKIAYSNDLKNDAAKINEYAKDIVKQVNALSQLSSGILEFWNGDDAKSITKEFDELLQQVNKFYDSLSDYINFVGKVPNVYNAIEEEYSKRIEI